jgi:hypothetical protein
VAGQDRRVSKPLPRLSTVSGAPSTHPMSSSSDPPNASSTNPPNSPTPRSPTSPPAVMPNGEGDDTVLLERVKAAAGPTTPPATASEDPTPPPQSESQPQSESESEPELEPEPDPAAIAAEAEKLKEQGNESFKRARYGEAVDLYTKAIGMSSIHPSLLSYPQRSTE